jgi:hypothetical protein
MNNYEKLAINQVVYELSGRRLCYSKEADYLKNFDDYCIWLADLTNSKDQSNLVDFAYALYSLNMWSHEIKEVEFKLQAQLVMYQYIKYTINIFTGNR